MISFKKWCQIQEGQDKETINQQLSRIKGVQRSQVDWQSMPKSQTFDKKKGQGVDQRKIRKQFKANINKGQYD